MRGLSRLVAALALAGASFVGVHANAATPNRLGASFADVRAAYPEGHVVRLPGGQRAIELEGVDYRGLQWKRVDFEFDASDRLAALAMKTRAARYEQILALAEADPSPSQVEMTADSPIQADMQIRVCEGDDGEVTLRFEPISAPV